MQITASGDVQGLGRRSAILTHLWLEGAASNIVRVSVRWFIMFHRNAQLHASCRTAQALVKVLEVC